MERFCLPSFGYSVMMGNYRQKNDTQAGRVRVLLFTTSGCHLCEQAEVLVAAAGADLQRIEIADDDGLLEEYGLRIPVLALSRDAAPHEQLGWPFDEAKLREWLESRRA